MVAESRSALAPLLMRAVEELALDESDVERWVKRLDDPYTTYSVKKRSGRGRRRLDVPDDGLKRLQSWLLKNHLEQRAPHPLSFAYRRELGTLDCAHVHSEARWLLRVDIKDFFTTIDERMAYRSIRHGSKSKAEAFQLARIVTRTPSTLDLSLPGKYWEAPRRVYRRSAYLPARLGFLPQGAPTSGYVSNLVMFGIDKRLARLAEKEDLRYSRYADDMYFSTRREWNRSSAVQFLAEATGLIQNRNFTVNPLKTRISGPGARKLMLGLRVDERTPRLPTDFRRRVEWHLRGVAMHGLEGHAQHAGFSHPRQLAEHVRGLLDYALGVDPVWTDQPRTVWRDLSSEWILDLE